MGLDEGGMENLWLDLWTHPTTPQAGDAERLSVTLFAVKVEKWTRTYFSQLSVSGTGSM